MKTKEELWNEFEYACYHRDVQKVKQLIEEGLLNYEYKKHPFWRALLENAFDIAKLFLDQGFSIASNPGYLPNLILIEAEYREEMKLHRGVTIREKNPTIYFIIENGAPLDVIVELQEERLTPLELAYRFNLKDVIARLEAHGAKRYLEIQDDHLPVVSVLEFGDDIAPRLDYRNPDHVWEGPEAPIF